ncbi:hypothetical protein BH10PSE13_BH10PSE13_23660 [soil metagenome]
MSRKRGGSPNQHGSTKPRPTDAAGRELDQWGLPSSGPARVRALAELDKPDPNVAPEAWPSAGTPASTSDAGDAPDTSTEENNG